MGMEPARISRAERGDAKGHTHGHGDAEEAADDAIDRVINLIVGRLGAVHLPVRLLAHAEAEEVGFAHDEVEILIVHLTDALRRVGLRRLGGKLLQERPRDGGQEVDVGGRIAPDLQVPRDVFQIGGRGLDEIDDGNVGDGMALAVDVSADGAVSARRWSLGVRRECGGSARTDGW